MVVLKRRWGNMRDDISVVNHSEDGINLVGDVLGHSSIPDSRASKVMNYQMFVKLLFQSESCNFRKGCSQTVSCRQNGGSRMLLNEFLNCMVDFFLDSSIIIQKPSMNFASFAIIANFLEHKILNPILYIS